MVLLRRRGYTTITKATKDKGRGGNDSKGNNEGGKDDEGGKGDGSRGYKDNGGDDGDDDAKRR